MVIEMPFDLVHEVRCFFALARELERVLHDAIGAFARKRGELRDDFAVGALVHPAADVAVLAFGVLADHHVVDVAGLPARERAGHAFEQAHRPQVHVEVEPAAEVDEQAPHRDVVGHQRRIADRAEIDRVELAQDVGRVLGAHAAVRLVPVAAPREFLPREAQAVLGADGFQHAHAFGDHFASDAVAGDDRDEVLFHARSI